MQIVFFFIDRHWDTVHDDLRLKAFGVIVRLLKSDNVNIQAWAGLCLGSLALQGVPLSPEHNSRDSQSIIRITCAAWEPILKEAINQIPIRANSRTACHLVDQLLRSSCLPHHKVVGILEGFLRGVGVQGPTYPFESACLLLSRCLDFSAGDVTLSSLGPHEKVFNWLSNAWTESRQRSAQVDLPSFLLLCSHICAFTNPIVIPPDVLLPDCPVSRAMSNLREEAVLRDWLLQAKLPPARRAAADPLRTDEPDEPTTTQTVGDDPSVVQNQTIQLFELALRAVRDEFKDHDMWATAGWERIHQLLLLAVAVLLYDAALQVNGVRHLRPLTQDACFIISKIGPHLVSPRWSLAGQGALFLAISPCFAQFDQSELDFLYLSLSPCLIQIGPR